MGWWLLAGATLLVDGITWTFTMRLPRGRRARAIPHQVCHSIWSLPLLAYALAHVGGAIGAACARLMPRWPAWVYDVLVFFLAIEVLYLISWFAYQFYSRHASPPVAEAWLPEIDV